MARQLHRLSFAEVKNAKPGMYGDGGGLYLQATLGSDDAINRSWIFRYANGGRERHMGLGSLQSVTLAGARQAAAEARKLRGQGIDPIEARDASRANAAALAAKQSTTFRAAAEAYIAAHRSSWKNVKHAAQWGSTLATYAYPIIGAVPAHMVDDEMVLKVLKPLWYDKPETASRLRGRIEKILDQRSISKHRMGDNPARWRGNLETELPNRSKVRGIRHHPAMPYGDVPAFLKALRAQDGLAPRALEWTILTASRTGETIGATLEEISSREKAWTVPADRMKSRREHRVPLSAQALAIVDELAPVRGQGRFLFPGRTGQGLTNMAMLMLLERMGHADITVHGFRSTFRDWAAERTNFANEVVEMALAHAVEDKTEAAYRRGDLFDKRRRLMDTWAEYCKHGSAASADVVPLRA
jgi:integrase